MLAIAGLVLAVGGLLFSKSKVAHYEKLERMTDKERADYYRATGK